MLFDHLVGASKGSRRNAQAKIFGRLEIDHKLELRRLQNRHFCRVRSFQNLSNVLTGLAVHPADAWAIAQERANSRELPEQSLRPEACGDWRMRQSARADRAGSGLSPVMHASALATQQLFERRIDFASVRGIQRYGFKTQFLCPSLRVRLFNFDIGVGGIY